MLERGHAMAFGDNEMDRYSTPVRHKKTALAELFVMPERAKPEKPGRAVTVTWDARQPLLPGFINRYSYVVRFTQRGGQAGNHYHRQKHELYFAVRGKFRVVLEDMQSKQREEFTLQEGDNTFLYVKPPVAHVVVSESASDVLLVIASSPEVTTDEFAYPLDV